MKETFLSRNTFDLYYTGKTILAGTDLSQTVGKKSILGTFDKSRLTDPFQAPITQA